MEFLQELFSNKALTYTEFAGILAQHKEIKLANLAGGDYVGSEKYKALLAQQARTKQQLADAQQALEKWETIDVEELKTTAETYKTLAEKTQQEAEENLFALQCQMAAERQSGEVLFSSASAKKAFMAALLEKRLPLEAGQLQGFAEFEAEWRENDPAAFADEGPLPRIVAPITPPVPESGWREKLGQNYQNAKQEQAE